MTGQRAGTDIYMVYSGQLMKIDCYFSYQCMTEDRLRENLTEAIELEGVEAEVTYSRIGNETAAEKGLIGSPTILINGRDPFPAGDMTGFS